jgi:hypothetical protein
LNSDKQPASLSAESQPTHTNPEPGTRKGRKQEHQPKTVQDYLPSFKSVVENYRACLSFTKFASHFEGFDPQWPTSRVVAASRYVFDVEQSASQMLDPLPLWFAWINLLRRYGGLGFYAHVPEDVEQEIIVAVGREWKRLGLHEVHEYFNRQIADQGEPFGLLGTAVSGSVPVAGSGVGLSETTGLPCMQQGVERRCKSNQEVNAK